MTATEEPRSAEAGVREEALDRLESEVATLFRRARHVLAVRAAQVHPGLHGASYLVLRWVAEHGPVRAGAIAEEFCVDKASVSRMVQSLTDMGLVTREPDPADGRASLVSATEEARTTLGRVDAVRREHFMGQMSDWTTEQLEGFGELFARYNETIESMPEGPQVTPPR